MDFKYTKAAGQLDSRDKRNIEEPVKIIYSRGSTGNLYTLTRTGLVWTCTCKAFKYRPGPCKHIRARGGSLVKKAPRSR
jgi:hypothetical protein